MTKTIFSPYRISPLGAHVDHQGGIVLGNAIRIGTTISYEPLDSQEVRITSEELGEGRFSLGGPVDKTHWLRYAQAAAHVLPQATRGMRARISGALIGAGLSSSASVGLAYIKALADVNDIEVTDDDLVRLDFELENRHLGLQNGMLDPLTIVHGRKHALLLMDMAATAVTPIPDPPGDESAWIIAYSGVSRELIKSGYNARVQECRQAAAFINERATKFSDNTFDEFERRKAAMPAPLRRRAEHFFGEVERVRRGAHAWREADYELFGKLMNESCDSSISKYESGSELLIELHGLVSGTPGIYGSRFSGGGFGGCVVALAKNDHAKAACEEIAGKFKLRHPELPAKVFVAETGEGLSGSDGTARGGGKS
jgi:galactokinase/galacturonokinase